MYIKKLMILISYACFISVCSAAATTTNSTDLNSVGFKFSPFAHAHTAELLEFIANYSDLEKEGQKSVYLEVMQALAKDKSDIKFRIKHAAILALPNSNLRDTSVAQQHLEALLTDSLLNASNTSVVKLLLIFTLDHNAQSQKKQDAAKKVDILKLKNKALEQKLNDLKNIEKTMIERNVKNNNK